MKVFWKVLAALAAIAAVGAALYCFRDKLKALFGCDCGKVEFVAEEEQAAEEALEEVPVEEAPVEEAPAEEVTPADFAE